LGAPHRVGDQARQAIAQGFGIFHGCQEARDAILDGFWNAPDT
jgi:hypothetical protein